MKKSDSRLVYSSDTGRICPKCEKYFEHCSCRKKQDPAASVKIKEDGIVRVGRETKGRKGKGVTTISGVPLPADGIKKLAKELKQKCGTGGTCKDGIIEIQGDHRDTLIQLLADKGWTVKRSGG